MLLAFNLTRFASATLTRDCSWPLERKASARSFLTCAEPSFILGVDGVFGAFAGLVEDEVLAAFSASSAVVRSSRLVTISD